MIWIDIVCVIIKELYWVQIWYECERIEGPIDLRKKSSFHYCMLISLNQLKLLNGVSFLCVLNMYKNFLCVLGTNGNFYDAKDPQNIELL
jgi:hypothetical protein